MEDRRNLDPAPPARGPAAAAATPPEAELGGPCPARDPARHDTQSPPPGAAASGHPGHDRALAPRHRPPPLGSAVHACQDRPASHPPEHQGPGPPAGPRESRMGLPQDPRGTGRPGSQGRGVDRMGDPQGQRHRPRATTDRASLVAVPEFSGRGDPGVRFLQRRPARRHPGLRPDRDRARDAAHPHPRRHAASHGAMDQPAGTQSAYGPRRAGAAGQVHDPRPRLELHRRIRRRPGRRRDPDRAL